jgi:hypothetical protein
LLIFTGGDDSTLLLTRQQISVDYFSSGGKSSGMRLKSRQSQIPEGLVFYEPSTKWRSTPWASFDVIVQEVIAHRRGNPYLMQKFGKSIDQQSVENEVDEFNANLCAQMNWMNFIVGAEGSPPPGKSKPPSPLEISQLSAAAAKVKNIWSGLRTIGEWLDANGPVVDQQLADARAATCVACPLNGQGEFGKWFVAPAAAAIKRQVEKIQGRGLKTASDEKLGVCEGCTCAMKVKCWVPIGFIQRHTSDETMDALRKGNNCWQIRELAAS